MSLQSQRFRGVSTLERCVTQGYRLTFDDPDAVAVGRLQDALADLGYLHMSDVDGIFGKRTGKAVTAFKIDSSLSPTDPVVGSGTMTTLDGWFAGEPIDPDAPDASTAGLDGLVDAAVATIRTWATTSRDALMAWPSADPADLSPNRLAYEAALERNFRVSTIDWREELIAFALLPVSEAVLRLLDGAIRFVVRDRATFMVHSRTYEPVDQSPGLIVNVSPPFRNAMDDNGRAGELYRALAHVSYPVASIRGWPGTVRYSALDTGEQTRNSVAYASFAYETTTGFQATFRPEPLWYP